MLTEIFNLKINLYLNIKIVLLFCRKQNHLIVRIDFFHSPTFLEILVKKFFFFFLLWKTSESVTENTEKSGNCVYSNLWPPCLKPTVNLSSSVVQAIYDMLGACSSNRPADSAEDRAKNIFAKMDENNDGQLTQDEFLKGCLQDEELSKMLAP